MDMEQLYNYLPRELVTFVLVTLFSLLIGLSQRRISLKREGETTLFGTDRTFTFIGILGYLLYILDPTDMRLFMGGGAVLGLLLGLNYYVKQSQFHVFGVTTIIIALITYCMAPIVATQPSWFYVMVIVTVLLLTELKHTFTEFAQRMKNDEMITLAKFLAISGIILPMLPNKNLIPDINLTPYSIWLATVVVSGISYLSYLLKRYVFHESGTLVSGIIGVPSGIGEPYFNSIESVLSHLLFSIPAVKGVEFGAGFSITDMLGSEANDSFYYNKKGEVKTKSNNNGGINGGISNGMPIIIKTAIKPTPSIYREQESIDISKHENIKFNIEGRHDPAIIHRARVVIDSVVAFGILDLLCMRYGYMFMRKEDIDEN